MGDSGEGENEGEEWGGREGMERVEREMMGVKGNVGLIYYR